jgi:hypothetical protein
MQDATLRDLRRRNSALGRILDVVAVVESRCELPENTPYHFLGCSIVSAFQLVDFTLKGSVLAILHMDMNYRVICVPIKEPDNVRVLKRLETSDLCLDVLNIFFCPAFCVDLLNTIFSILDKIYSPERTFPCRASAGFAKWVHVKQTNQCAIVIT